ncbi:MAG: hypothetical protein WAU01_12170 [Saprospiraceae bacterium]
MITVDSLYIAHQEKNKSTTLPNLEKHKADIDEALSFLDQLRLDAKPVSASWEEFEKRTLISVPTAV